MPDTPTSLTIPRYLIIILTSLAISCNNKPSHRATANTIPDTIPPVAAVPAASIHTTDTTPRKRGPNTFLADLDNDGVPDTLTVTPAPPYYGTFTAITISIKGHPKQIFKVADTSRPWTDFDMDWSDTSNNVVPTKKFLLLKARTHFLLVLSGALYETGPREGLTMIKIEKGNAKVVFDEIPEHRDIESVYLEDLDHDGRFELLDVHSFQFDSRTDTLDGKIGPYNPKYVYTIDDSCFLNKPLMKKYNEEHYVFAGYERSDTIPVWYSNNRKTYRLWK
jgi:hypothetical protein